MKARSLILNFVFLTIAGLACAFSYTKMRQFSPTNSDDDKQSQEVLYLPNGLGLELMSFGYQKAFSHLLWFRTISYFAKHYRSDRNYIWLSHMCQMVSRLNPQADYVYQFCGVMLAWEGNLPEDSIKLLSQAMEAHPQNWIFPYLRGFVYAFFLSQDEKAKDDFIKSSELPNAHPIVIRLATKKILSLDSPENAAEFLTEAIKDAQDKQTRDVLADKLRDVYFELGFRQLEKASDDFFKANQRLPKDLNELNQSALVNPALAHSGFADPFGGHYYIDNSSGKILSSSKRKRSSLRWTHRKNEKVP